MGRSISSPCSGVPATTSSNLAISTSTVSAVGGKWDSAELFFGFQSYTVPPSVYRYDLSSGVEALWAKVDAPSIDPSGFEVSTEGGADYREGLVVVQRPLSLNPLVGADDPAVHDIGHLLYRSLLSLDATGYPRTDLAQSFAVSGDGLTYTVVLAPGSQWSDGSPITPADGGCRGG